MIDFAGFLVIWLVNLLSIFFVLNCWFDSVVKINA